METQQQQEIASDNDTYTIFTIVAEQCLSLESPLGKNTDDFYYNHAAIPMNTREWINGTEWNFTVIKIDSQQCTLKLTLLETEIDSKPVIAEVIFWQWQGGKEICTLDKRVNEFEAGAHYSSQIDINKTSKPSNGFFNALIRILEKKSTRNSAPYAPCYASDEVVLRVGTEQFSVSKHILMSMSPVFLKMFTVDMLERDQDQCTLGDIEAEDFGAFLEAISPPEQTAPNPTNVTSLLKLADRFQVEFLRKRCESHLINCVELCLFTRLLCSEVFHLEKLKNFILKSLNGIGICEFYEENQSELKELSKDLLIQLTLRICSNYKIDCAKIESK